MKKLILYLFIFVAITSCESDSSDASGASGGDGKGGSMARFAVSGNHLYTISTQQLHTFDISDSQHPFAVDEENIPGNIETIFPYGDHLFLGSREGMSIYNLAEPSSPSFVSNYRHIMSCDPVVTDGRYAYITLRNGSTCGGGQSRLEVVSLQNLTNPSFVQSYSMEEPYGLGIDGNLLFVCDNGIKVYDTSDPTNLVRLTWFHIKDAYDVIPHNGILMVTAADGLYQYKYENSDIHLLSKLSMPRP